MDNFDWGSIKIKQEEGSPSLNETSLPNRDNEIDELSKSMCKANLLSMIDSTRRDLRSVESSIISAEIEEKNYAKLEQRLSKVEDFISRLTNRRNKLAKIKSVTDLEADTFRENRLGFLGESITENLNEIFPYDKQTCKVLCTTKRGKQVAYAQLINSKGQSMIPAHTAGGLSREVIGFTAASTIVQCLGSKVFIFDEAFSMASEKIKARLGLLLEQFSSKGVQIFLVSQSDELYRDINCRCIYIYKDYLTNEVKVDKVIDKEGSN